MIITADRIITGNSNQVLEKSFIEIVGKNIKRVGSINELTKEELKTAVDYKGCTIVPGLINAHEHLATKTRITPGKFDLIKTEPVQLQMLRCAKNAKGLLSEGVTTIRECGSREHINLYISKGIKQGFIEGPEVLACGRPISITGGHCYYYSWQINSPAEAVKAVRTELMYGVDFIKVHATGGAGTLEGSPLWAELSLEELKAVVKEAHRVSKRVASHAIGRPGIENTLKAGVDTLEHGQYLDDELIEIMCKQGTFYTPTLSGYVPLAEHGLEMGRPQWMVDKAKKLVDQHRVAIERVRKYKEIVVAVGTDSSGEVVEEMELLHSNGYSNLETIIMATQNSSKVLGIEDRVGTIEKGKQADLLVAEGNPIKKLSDLRNVKQVYKFGKCVYKNNQEV